MSRIQLALNVEDLDQAIKFYSRLFDIKPVKIRPGYANFSIAEPPLKLVLFEKPGDGSSINHLGVEVQTVEEVLEAENRFTGKKMTTTGVEKTQCCYAEKTETWVESPDGIRWEWYVKQDDTEQFKNLVVSQVETSRNCCD